ncbi:MAG TPA: nuclear transport factor 2 family protein [Candidatus Baltobacteraceae bacterium]|nr:nuclear transport factor 2 family protein [Candidatus Baltobacteraceae bacterium]
MRTVVAFVLAVLLTASAPNTVSSIEQLNARLQDETKAYDTAGVASMITPDFELVNGSGTVWPRTAFLADVGDRSAVWQLNKPEDVTVRVYNDDCAIVVAMLHLRYVSNKRLHDLLARYTDVWVKQGGKWRYASGQATVVKRLASGPSRNRA